MKINTKAILVILLIAISLTSTVSATSYNYYGINDDRSSFTDRSLRVRDQESFERSISYERIDQYNRLRRNRFLDDTPYYYDRVYYNRGNNYRTRSYTDSSSNYRTSIVRYQSYERFNRNLEIDRNDRNSDRRVVSRDMSRNYYNMPYYNMYGDMMYYQEY